jgi:hypothetical protein
MGILSSTIKADYPVWLQERIKAANSVFLILFFALLALFVMSLAFTTNVMMYFMIGSFVILGITVIIHLAGFHVVTRILISILPVFVSNCIQGAYQMSGELPNASAWVFVITFQVLPFLLFHPSEVRSKVIAVGINVLCSLSYQIFNQFIELDSAPPTPPFQVWITISIGVFMMVGLLFSLDRIFINANRDNLKLIKSIEAEREEQMRAKAELTKTLEQLNKAKIEDEQRAWSSNGIAEISLLLRDENTTDHYDRLASKIANYVNLNQLALYTISANDDGEKIIALKSVYAYNRKKVRDQKVDSSVGLLGQCYHEKSKIILTEVPADYVKITSGLGEATPRFVMMVPAIVNDEVEGIIELASFEVLQPFQILFIEQVCQIIAGYIRMTRIGSTGRRAEGVIHDG